MSLQTMLPKGESEPVALPKSGGFSGSPPPDPLREYVTSIMFACAIGGAQKLRAKTKAAADRRVLEFTVHFLSVFKRIRTHAAIKVKETGCKASVNC
jgi:hypothetical protein